MISGILQYGLAVALAAHGMAHLSGFAAYWRLVPPIELPSKTILGDQLSDAGARLVGVLWLQTAAAYVGLAASVALRGSLPAAPAAAVLLISTTLCVIGWPQRRTGLLINLVLVAGLSAFGEF